MRNKIGDVILVLGFLICLYVGGWLMLIKPILDCYAAYGSGALTWGIIGWNFLKFCFAGPVIWFIAWGGAIVRLVVVKWNKNKE